jgi:hypothetical protein
MSASHNIVGYKTVAMTLVSQGVALLRDNACAKLLTTMLKH